MVMSVWGGENYVTEVQFDVKGYGFIKPEDGSDDVFVHVSAAERAGIRGPLQEGMRVGYEVEADRRTGKPRAADLRLL